MCTLTLFGCVFGMGGSSSRSSDERFERTLNEILARHRDVESKRVSAVESASRYLERARSALGGPGNGDGVARRHALRLYGMHRRMSEHASGLANVCFLLEEHMLALEEQRVTRGVVSMVRLATGELERNSISGDSISDHLESASAALEGHQSGFEQLSSEVNRGTVYGSGSTFDDDGFDLDSVLFGSSIPSGKAAGSLKSGGSVDRCDAVAAEIAALESALSGAPCVPSGEPVDNERSEGVMAVL